MKPGFGKAKAKKHKKGKKKNKKGDADNGGDDIMADIAAPQAKEQVMVDAGGASAGMQPEGGGGGTAKQRLAGRMQMKAALKLKVNFPGCGACGVLDRAFSAIKHSKRIAVLAIQACSTQISMKLVCTPTAPYCPAVSLPLLIQLYVLIDYRSGTSRARARSCPSFRATSASAGS